MVRVVGIDEVGRGSWAGPLVAAAVLLKPSFVMPDEPHWKLADSKILTRINRNIADVEIRKIAEAIGVGWVTSKEVDDVGLTRAVGLAMARAVEQIKVSYDEIIIDGSVNFLPSKPSVKTLVKADATIAAVSAASIIAKVARDNFMREVALRYPLYGFDKHVGYGTKLHSERLVKYGVCDLHRRTFLPVKAAIETSAT